MATKHVRKGDAYIGQEMFKASVIVYKNVVDALPGDPEVRYHYGAILAKRKNLKKRKPEFEVALKMSSDLYRTGDARRYLTSRSKNRFFRYFLEDQCTIVS